MNDLNLRVAALKLCAHPKRFAELRDALVPLPNTWIAAPHDFVRQFAAAKSSAEQVQVVKDVFYGDQQQDHEKVPRFLADLLLASPLRHAVRNQLTKLFSDNALAKQKAMPHHRHARHILLQALEQSLSEMASSLAVITPPVSHERTNDVFASANACLQNFPFGREALGKQVHLFAPLLTTALERYWTDICDPTLELSPTRRNELYLYLQNALRFLVSLLAEWSDQLHLTEDQRFPGTANVVAQKVARHEDTPWDVRSIAGLLIGHLARFSGTFQKYVEHCSRPQAEQDVPAQTAALLVLRPTDYAENAAQALAILKTIVSVGEQKSTVTNLLVFLSKHLFIYSKSLGEIHAHLPEDQKVLYEQILAELQVFALQNISNDTDSVRHMSSALLHQVLQHAQAVGQEELFQVVYRQFVDREASLNASCMALEQLVAVAGVNQSIENCPSLFGVIFPRHLGCEDSVDALFKAMMVSAHKTEPFAEWQSRWFGQLLAAIRLPEKRRPVIEELIAQAVQLEPTRLAQLLLPDTRLPLSCKLAAILGVRQLSARRQILLRSMKEEVEQALIGLDDHTRLLALRFLVETPRPSELLNADQMVAIELYVRHNANNPSAHLRQLGYGLLQKALKRVHFGLVEYRKSRTPASQEVFQFLIRLIRILSENMFSSANYGRRWLSLRLLRDCLELTEMVGITFSEMGIELPTKPLMACLGDSYEHNKVLAAQLLETFQSHSLFKPDEMIQLLLSLRPSDSATGAFQLQVYCKANIVQSELPTPAQSTPDTIHAPLTFRALQWCLQHLKEGLCLAQLDLGEAAKLNPLYGLLFASRHLLQQLKLKELAKEPHWRQYIEELVTICLAVSSVVLPVVSSASPEGHLPETCDQETDQPLTNVLDRQLTREELQQVRTTPQMILLCAWRSSKEVCLILGELVQRAPLEEEEQQRQGDFLLSCAQLEAIGEHFLQLLAETKHRGAFEQAYVGFTMLCRRFWHSESVRLNQLPGQWVNEAMAMVSGQEEWAGRGARLCATRRSAGMPFMLQALVCTELKLGTHATLYRCMHRLLEVCERRTAGAAGITARSHALNIMRALFRSSELAELVTEFMARGIQCALDGLLLAEEWAERNSATLLLAALIVRVFGVERARLETGELHVRNRMTGRIFFTRYPQLFDYFHAALQRESEQMDSGGAGSDNAGGKRRQAVQLEAMLLMLSRLYPSSLEGAESTLNLSEFVPFLIRICHSHDLLTREMAAQVVANFVTQEQALAEIRRIVIELKALQLRLKKQEAALSLNINLLHGQLLLLLHLHRLVRWTRPSLTRMQLHTLAALAAPLLQHDACAFSALVEVMVAAMEDAVEPGLLDYQLLEQIGAVYLLDHKEVQRRCQQQGISKRFYQIFGLHLHRLRGISQGIVLHIVEDLAEPIWALDELKVELWLYILLQRSLSKQHSLVSEADIEHFDFSGDIRRYFETLSQEQREEVAQEVYESPAVRSSVLQMIKSSRSRCWSLQLAGRLAALQPLLRDPELDLHQLVQRCSEEHATHQEAGLLLGLRRLIGESKTLERKHWLPVLNYAQRLLHPGQPVYLRHQAAELCDLLARNHLRDQLAAGITDVDIELVGRFIGLVLLLLHDDAEWVRHRAVQLVCGAGLRSAAEQEQGARAPLILPSALTQNFLDTMIDKLALDDVKVVQRLVNIISEPFTSSAAKELFDKQENNHYCERNHVLVGLWEARTRAYSRARTPLNEVSNS